MTQTRGEIIEEAMVQEMTEQGIDDTPENRLAFLTGLQEGWREDPSTSLEKSMYLVTISLMITRYRIKVALPTV